MPVHYTVYYQYAHVFSVHVCVHACVYDGDRDTVTSGTESLGKPHLCSLTLLSACLFVLCEVFAVFLKPPWLAQRYIGAGTNELSLH